jgi:hypothetical protein
MMDLRRYLLRALLFGLCCALTYPAYLGLWSALLPTWHVPNLRYPLGNYGMMHSRLTELREHGPVDAVFLGSSHTYRGFDPRIWEARGISAFNLGSSSQTPLQTEVLVNRYIDILRPRLAIMEVHPAVLQDDGVESSLDLIANDRIDLATAQMALRVGHVLTFNALAYGKLRQLTGMDREYREPQVKPLDGDRYIGDGFVEHAEGHFTRPEQPLDPRSAKPSESQLAALDRVLKALHDRGIAVVLVEVPVTSWYASGAYTDRDGFEALMTARGAYVNMNGKVALDDSLHFYDKGHLNQAGADVFNPVLIDTLMARGLLPAGR